MRSVQVGHTTFATHLPSLRHSEGLQLVITLPVVPAVRTLPDDEPVGEIG